MWSWRTFLRVLWTARRPNRAILKEINPEYSLEGLMLNLQYIGYLMQRADSLEKILMLGKIEGRRRRGRQRMRCLDGITNLLNGHEFEQTPADGEGQGSLVCCSPWGPNDWETDNNSSNYFHSIYIVFTTIYIAFYCIEYFKYSRDDLKYMEGCAWVKGKYKLHFS